MHRLALLFPLATIACEVPEEMSALEAVDALSESLRSARGEEATTEVVEISTDFTIGSALQAAAEEIAAFWESQADCTTVSVSDATATIDYGTLEDDCVYNGNTYAGVNTITVSSATLGELEVLHVWNGFTNGDVTVDGEATVTWSGTDGTRRVVTEHTWSDTDGSAVDVRGDHVQGLLDEGAGLLGGITMDGTRDWTNEDGEAWALSMEALELRLQDPAPQAGTVTVADPKGRELVVLYERVDDDTIQATLQGVRGGDRVYHINAVGRVEEVPAS